MGREEILRTLIERVEKPERHARLVDYGLFLKEESIDYIAKEYCTLLNITLLQPEQATLAAPEFKMPLSYLEDPQFCWMGRYMLFIPFKKDAFEKARATQQIPESTGKIYSCAYYLSPRDPLFRNHPTIHFFTEGEILATITTAKKEYFIPKKVFDSFAITIQRTPRSRQMFATRFETRRDCMKALESLLKCSERVRPLSRQIPAFLKRDNRRYRTAHGWYFALENDILVDVGVVE